MKFFDLESPLMQALGKMADLMWLNVLTMICCIPIITVGPALTAMHYTALRIVRNEEGYISKDYFKSFKENFKQATLIWLILLAFILILIGDFYIMRNSGLEFSTTMQTLLLVVVIIVMFTGVFIFPVQARFENTILNTIKNAFFIATLQFPKTILMMIMTVAPVVLFLFFPQITPIIFLFGFSAPAWVSAKLYNKFFQKLEDSMILTTDGEAQTEGETGDETEEAGEDERIFKDELDETLVERETQQR